MLPTPTCGCVVLALPTQAVGYSGTHCVVSFHGGLLPAAAAAAAAAARIRAVGKMTPAHAWWHDRVESMAGRVESPDHDRPWAG